jgi:Ni,Fe-hydrogenase III large subunit
MPLRHWWERAVPIGGAPSARAISVEPDAWRPVLETAAAAGARLLGLWAESDPASGAGVYAAVLAVAGPLVIHLPLGRELRYRGIEDLFPAAGRMQRAAADLSGVQATSADTRPWLRHAAWDARTFPLVEDPVPGRAGPPPVDDYPFVRVEGEGVHEIAVGPVHAGIIEPGHFRFSVVGEKVLRLEERLGYVHKGIEHLFARTPVMDGHRLAARISGDSAVAFSWAYCQAAEGMAGQRVPRRAEWLRALALELERIGNHLGDLGALGNDAGFAFGLIQFGRLKELLLRAIQRAFGQRYLLDFVGPGGTRVDLDAGGARVLLECVAMVGRQTELLHGIYDEHAGLRDRFDGAGAVSPELARRLGLTGLAGRASAQAFDLRVDAPWHPYDELEVVKIARQEGDVLARVAVRFGEVMESCRLVQRIISSLPAGPHVERFSAPREDAFGIGVIEGWRGPAFIALEVGSGGQIARCHPQDPSWHNWPVLEHAIIGNIVPDFPLINKSFNLSYSGHDL